MVGLSVSELGRARDQGVCELAWPAASPSSAMVSAAARLLANGLKEEDSSPRAATAGGALHRPGGGRLDAFTLARGLHRQTTTCQIPRRHEKRAGAEPDPRMKVLLTGFEGYGPPGLNPTEQIVRALEGVDFAVPCSR